MALTPMTALPLGGKRVLIRQDLNTPRQKGRITSPKRIEAALGTIQLARDSGAKVMLMSHAGRPLEGRFDAEQSLAPVATYLSESLGCAVRLCDDYLERPPVLTDGEVMLLENVRFNRGENDNDDSLARRYAALCDVFVMDAFGTAHRKHASTYGVARYAPAVCAGPLLLAELDALHTALEAPRRPMIAVVGGAKVSTKLTVLESLLTRVDLLIPGGGIANTFLAAAGHAMGQSLVETELIPTAGRMLDYAAEQGRAIPLPRDVVVGAALSATARATVKSIDEVADEERIFDIGPATAQHYARLIERAGTIVWNGPVGVCEFPQFAQGTETLGRAIARSKAFSIVGGGDTLAVVEQFSLTGEISYVSTGGGAFLELLQGKPLPAVEALAARA